LIVSANRCYVPTRRRQDLKLAMALQIVLALLGALLWLASRVSESFRRAITRDLVFEISSEDGVARAADLGLAPHD
jgi:hypothetical protein